MAKKGCVSMQYLNVDWPAVLAVYRPFCPGRCPGPDQPWGNPLVTGMPGQGEKGSQYGGGEFCYQVVFSLVLPLVTVRCRSDPLVWPEARGP